MAFTTKVRSLSLSLSITLADPPEEKRVEAFGRGDAPIDVTSIPE